MKFKFTVQQYQTDAVKSVTKVFAGQNFASPLSYRRDVPWETQGALFAGDGLFDDMAVGFANAPVTLDNTALLTNINRVQSENNIKSSQNIESKGLGACSIDVEMETGTGKTYVYIKTMFELNREYSWTKLMVVVPSIAIREGVRFIFSHSALREGWDNPNVFQICALKHGGNSPTQKRQEVWRGLRLSVNARGDRQDESVLGSQVQKVNHLTVIAADSYKDFVAGLQEGIKEDLYERPTIATAEYFTGKTLTIDGKSVTVAENQGRIIYNYLIRNDYVDDDGYITDKYREDKATNSLAPLPETLKNIESGVHTLIGGIFDPSVLQEMAQDGRNTTIPDNPLNDNFYNDEFKKLWNLISHKYAYTVEFDGE